jgi:predicted PurR-regulated permease PerM
LSPFYLGKKAYYKFYLLYCACSATATKTSILLIKMNNQTPYYKQVADRLFLFIMVAAFVILAQKLLLPIVFSILFAIILLPFNNFLERIKFPKALANLTAVIAGLVFLVALIYFFSLHISNFAKDLPTIKNNLQAHYNDVRHWLKHEFHLSTQSQAAIINNATKEVQSSGGSFLGQTFLSISSALLLIVLVTFYTFFILFYRHLIKKFFFAVFSRAKNQQVDAVLTKSKKIIQQYVTGLLIEMVIVATLNSIILLIIGIKYAVFFGILSGVLNIIPYIGIFSTIAFTVLVTLSTSANMGNVIWIVVGMGCVHLTDANFILPKVVGSKVKINALISFTCIVAGAEYIGIAGIFLALPVMAVLKIIFDSVDGLKAWGLLMGEEPEEEKPGKALHL